MDNDNDASVMPVPWGRLKAWIEAQEQAEESGFNSDPPSKAQVAALSHVVDFLDGPEPTAEMIGKLDYVSELMQLAQNKQVAPPKFEELTPIDVPVDGVFSKRFRTVCYLPAANNKQFPCLGHGLYDGGQAPLWKSKKLSKQYAAKCAYKYWKAHSGASTSSNGGVRLASNSNGNNNARVRSNSSAKARAPSGSAPGTSPSSSTGDLTTVEDTDFYDSETLPSLLDQVKRETAYLKLGYPNFEIWADEESPGAFAGKPVFRNNSTIPADMGHVKGALTRALAKELMAEAVLKFCQTYRKRKEGLVNTWRE
ncbi:hypothetical protein TRIATDRAFT_255508 [Trichoderma atroviride IMI 206040]|uniref:DRBM domain-containing protein n=2 Tax=Hypocrea atroviridis TaxID=63577 RepID=G9NLZ9_HYPAI|nr:uncharacterized protein TRIATDRAFT_255508 [Trichoderma atroviride IMI 206040]EHK47933.1 hypothetical protein TRIATDRAFT_255508 [Trichoderma atroviride IMI 206040]